MSRPPRRRRHPVVGRGDVRPHPLAVAVDERPRVAASARHPRHPRPGAGGQARPRRRRRRRPRSGGSRPPRAAPRREARRVDLGAHPGAHPQRRLPAAVGEVDPQPGRIDAVAASGVGGRDPGAAEVGDAGEAPRVEASRRGARRGSASRGMSSRMLRAAESAARSAARCTRPFPVTAPPIAASSSAAMIRIAPAPSTAGRACPRSPASAPRRAAPIPSSGRGDPPRRARGRPPGRAPARARRAASGEASGRGDPGSAGRGPELVDGERGQRALRAAARPASRPPSAPISSAVERRNPEDAGQVRDQQLRPARRQRRAERLERLVVGPEREVAEVAAGRRRDQPAARSASSSSRAAGVGEQGRRRRRLRLRRPRPAGCGRPVAAAASTATAAASARLPRRPRAGGEDRRRAHPPLPCGPRPGLGADLEPLRQRRERRGRPQLHDDPAGVRADRGATAGPGGQRLPRCLLRVVARRRRQSTRLGGAVGEGQRVAGEQKLEGDEPGQRQRRQPSEQLHRSLASLSGRASAPSGSGSSLRRRRDRAEGDAGQQRRAPRP